MYIHVVLCVKNQEQDDATEVRRAGGDRGEGAKVKQTLSSTDVW